MSMYIRPLSFVLDKNGKDRTADSSEGMTRYFTRGAHEYEYQTFDRSMQALGMPAFRQEKREISFLRHIVRTTHRKVRSSTVDKIIAKRESFKEPEYEPSKVMRNLIISHGLSILKLDLPPEKLNLNRMHCNAIRYFDSQRNIRAEQERLS